MLIREVPKISSYDVWRTKDVEDFLREFENYCKVKCPENKAYWVKELNGCLQGRMLDFYSTITSVGEFKYETVKESIVLNKHEE